MCCFSFYIVDETVANSSLVCFCFFYVSFFFFSVVSSSGSSVIPQVCRLCNSTRGAACNWVNATCNVKNKYCYAFWTNDSHGVVVSHAGCWDQNDHCETSSCAGRKVSKKNKTAFFCCCNASFCNLDLSVATDEPTSRTLTPPSVPGKSRACFSSINVYVSQ